MRSISWRRSGTAGMRWRGRGHDRRGRGSRDRRRADPNQKAAVLGSIARVEPGTPMACWGIHPRRLRGRTSRAHGLRLCGTGGESAQGRARTRRADRSRRKRRPVFDVTSGEVIGIAESRFDEERAIGFATPIDEATRFLAAHRASSKRAGAESGGAPPLALANQADVDGCRRGTVAIQRAGDAPPARHRIELVGVGRSLAATPSSGFQRQQRNVELPDCADRPARTRRSRRPRHRHAAAEEVRKVVHEMRSDAGVIAASPR